MNLKKTFSILATLSITMTVASSVHANPKYNSDDLFDFYSNSQNSSAYSAQYTSEQRTNIPISSTIYNEQNSSNRYIVKLKKNVTEKEKKKLLGNLGTYSQTLDSAMGFSAYIPKDNITNLSKNPLVSSVFVDSVVFGLGESNDVSLNTMSIPQVWKEASVKGTGVGVAVLDTGVFAHDDLTKPTNRIVSFEDFVNGKTQPYDDSGHGTHVAGIIAAGGSSYNGASPNVNLIVGKVLDANERGSLSNVIEGIDWVIENKEKYNIKVLNLSLGLEFSSNNDPLITAVDKAWNSGIVVVTAAGNGGAEAKVMSPAASQQAIAVGSVDPKNTSTPSDDEIASFSVQPQTINGVSKPDIFAPGKGIISLLSPGSTLYYQNNNLVVDGMYYKMSGTSMSAPYVSSAAALLLEKYPNLTPNQVKSKITTESINKGNYSILNVAKEFGLTPKFDTTYNATPNTSPSQNVSEPVIIKNPQVDSSNNQTGNVHVQDQLEAPQNHSTPSVPPSNSSTTTKGSNTTIIDFNAQEQSNVGTANSNPTKTTIPTTTTPAQNQTPTPAPKPHTPDNRPVVTFPNNPDYNDNGYQFVKDTYSTSDILNALSKNADSYKNGKELQDKDNKLQDIINLFNYINRSFTREDFLFFEQRMNK